MAKKKLEKYFRSADMGDNAAITFVNYGVKKKSEGKYRLARVFMISAYIVFVAGFFTFFATMNILPVIALLPVLTWILIFFTWRFVSIEYEYYILDGEFKLLKVYGSKNMRELCRVRISSMGEIAPYKDGNRRIDAIPEENRIYGVSTMKDPDIYYAIFKDEKDTKCAVFFEATEKTLKGLKYYKSDIEVVKTTR